MIIFNFLPDLFWPALLVLGLLGFLLSYLPQVKTYAFILKNVSLVVVASTIFLCGMLYANNTWKSRSAELTARVAELEAQSQAVNTVIKDRVVTRIQIVKVRGAETTQYIDREVTKHDQTCVIPAEFVQAHNLATEPPK